MSKTFSLQQTRNIGILAHIDAGKTTVTERILFYAGEIHKMGEVHDGSATMDWMPQEQERGITITAASTNLNWQTSHINLIDTPGHVDFTVEVERSLRVLDGAVFILDAKEGVEPQTETVWRLANNYSVPRIVFVNKMDKIGADFESAVKMLTQRFHMKALPICWPIGSERDFIGVIDLIELCAYYFEGQQGEILRRDAIPEAYRSLVQDKRAELLESIAETDEVLLETYLEQGTISTADLLAALRIATLDQRLLPVLCGSAYRNKGIQLLLDAIVNYLPSPIDRGEITGFYGDQPATRNASDANCFSALVFKVMTDPYVGKLHYLRVYSGVVNTGQVVLNTSKDKRERMGKLVSMHANSRSEKTQATSGDIMAVVGLKHTTTGDTLTDLEHPIVYESMHFPAPVISMAIEPKTPAELEKLQQALERLTDEDPTLTVTLHPDTGQTLISGMGELHLEVIKDRLKTEFSLLIQSGKPQVSYKETLTESSTVLFSLDQPLGTNRLEATLELNVTPNERELGNVVITDKIHSQLSTPQLLLLQNAVLGALQSGVLGGYEVVDVVVEVTSVSFKNDNFADLALKTASSLATAEALKKGHPVLLEPLVKLVIHVPEATVGDVIDDLQKRTGIVLNIDGHQDNRIVYALAPLSKMFGYATSLRSKTQGRGTHTMQFSHYDVQN